MENQNSLVTCLLVSNEKIEVVEIRETEHFYVDDRTGQEFLKNKFSNNIVYYYYDYVALSTDDRSSDKIYLLNSRFASSDFVIEKVGLELLTKKFNTSHPNIEYIKKRYCELQSINTRLMPLAVKIKELEEKVRSLDSCDDLKAELRQAKDDYATFACPYNVGDKGTLFIAMNDYKVRISHIEYCDFILSGLGYKVWAKDIDDNGNDLGVEQLQYLVRDGDFIKD